MMLSSTIAMNLLAFRLMAIVPCADRIPDWYVGGYWTLPLQWLVSAAEANEFSDSKHCYVLMNFTVAEFLLPRTDFLVNQWSSLAKCVC